ncbi:MAG TPA: hypothetical protein VFI47_25975 [Acidimicrobiales bacterium]|nr:hypothetical protein [Acidimicrobiales bacterium]
MTALPAAPPPVRPPGPPPPTGRAPLVVGALAAVLAVGLLVVSAVAGVAASGAADDVDQARADAALVAAALSTDVIDALGDEGASAAAALLGFADAIELDQPSFAAAAAATDAAVADLRRRARGAGAAADPLVAALDALEPQLTPLRGSVAAVGADGRLDHLAEADAYRDGVDLLVDGLFAAATQVAAGIGDPEVGEGVTLARHAQRLTGKAPAVARAVLLASLDGGVNDPEEIAGLAEDLADIQATRATIDELASGFYRTAADELLAGEDVDAFVPQVEEVLRSGTADLSTGAVTAFHDAYATFEQRVADHARARADQVVDDAERRAGRATTVAAVAGGTGLVLGVAAAIILIRAVRRPRPRDA